MALQLKPVTDTVHPQLFDLQPGMFVDIQVNMPLSVRLKVMLIGYKMGSYIILQYPDPKKFGSYKDVLTDGNVLIVRYLLEGAKGECFAFKATIRHIAQYPDKLLYIDYPKYVENRQLRSHQRKVTTIPAAISLASKDNSASGVSGLIVDISLKGCRFVFKSDDKNSIVKKTDINVSINLPGIKHPVIIPAKVCNSNHEKDRIYVGVMFSAQENIVNDLIETLFID